MKIYHASAKAIPRINQREAVRLFASITGYNERKTLVYVNCQQDEVRLPLKCTRINPDGSIDVEEWLFDKIFPNG